MRLALAAIVALVVSVLLGTAVPRIYSIFNSLDSRSVELRTYQFGFGESPPCESVRPTALADFAIVAPALIHRSESFSVELSIEPSPWLRVNCPKKAARGFLAHALLSSAGMDIAPAERVEKRVVHNTKLIWVARPREAGEFLLVLGMTSPDGGPFEPARLAESESLVRATKDSVVLRVTVLTDLGLQATVERKLQVIGVLLGLIGTVFAYPFWKRRSAQSTTSS
jgi:hypothetical protein